jgi:hypothetical protein
MAIIGTAPPILSRRVLFCDKNEPTINRCTSLIGPGLCLDASQEEYPYCSNADFLSLEVCQKAASNAIDAIGLEYTDGECLILYDATKAFNCPANFNPTSTLLLGKGPIQESSENGSLTECYACE